MLRHVGRDIAHRPEFADFDPTSLHVWAYENYEPTIRNAARAIRHFDYWLAAHRNEMFLSSYSGNRLFCKRIWPKLWELHARHSTGGLRTAGWKDAPHAHFRMENGAIQQTQCVKHWKIKIKLTKTALFRRTVLIKNRLLLFIETITLHTAVKTENRGRPMQFIPKIP